MPEDNLPTEALDKLSFFYQKITCHMIFTVKMENFRRKARYVADGHKTEAPAVMTYASVVSRETVRIALTIAALNDLEVKGADIENAYITAPNRERVWTLLGPEWGPDAGKKAIVVRAQYGLKSAGASFRNHLADCMTFLGYKSCRADPDLWLKPETRPGDGFQYYCYVLIYSDDFLAIHHDKRVFAVLLNGLFPGAHSTVKVPLVIQPLASAESRGLTKSVCTLVSDPDVRLAVVRHELSA